MRYPTCRASALPWTFPRSGALRAIKEVKDEKPLKMYFYLKIKFRVLWNHSDKILDLPQPCCSLQPSFNTHFYVHIEFGSLYFYLQQAFPKKLFWKKNAFSDYNFNNSLVLVLSALLQPQITARDFGRPASPSRWRRSKCSRSAAPCESNPKKIPPKGRNGEGKVLFFV